MTTATQALSRKGREMRLIEALATLPVEQREALRLRYVEGLPSKDVAERLGKTDGSVLVMLTRAGRPPATDSWPRRRARVQIAAAAPKANRERGTALVYCSFWPVALLGTSSMSQPAANQADMDASLVWQQLSERLDAFIAAWEQAASRRRWRIFCPRPPRHCVV